MPWRQAFEGCPGPAADGIGRGLAELIDQVDPQLLEGGAAGRGGEPGDGHPDRRCPGGVRWPVGGRGRQEEGGGGGDGGEGLQGCPGPAADGIGRGLAELIDNC